VIFCHGSCSNKDRERTISAAEAYSKLAFGVLRFNFGGSGNSYDSEITVENQVEDLRAAVEFMKDRGYIKVGLQGESMGGLVVLSAYPPLKNDVRALILWAPVTRGKDKLNEVASQIDADQKDLNSSGFVIRHKDGKDFKIPRKYFEERLNIDQGELLGNIKCPVLIAHGDGDDTVSVRDSEDAIKILLDNGVDGRLSVIGGSGHKFEGYEDKLVKISKDWIKENF
jgi:pimeloyl-ACP methyl ester carboxylesterase